MAITRRGVCENSVTNGNNVVVTLPGGMAQNDVVVAFGGHGTNSATAATVTGYTTLVQGETGNLTGTDFVAAYKVQGATPDSTFTGIGGGNSLDAVAYVGIVYIGVDPNTPIDATTTEAITASGSPNSPSITTVTPGAVVISGGAANITDATVTAPSGYGNQVDRAQADTSNATVGLANIDKASAGAEDPPAWTNWTSASTWAATIALRPLLGNLGGYIGPLFHPGAGLWDMARFTPDPRGFKSTSVQYQQSLSGVLSFSGALVKSTDKKVTGVLSFSGALVKQTSKGLSGVLSFAGALSKQTQKNLSGVLSFSGALSTSRLYVISLTGVLSFSGALTKQTNKNVSGVLSFAGALVKQTNKNLVGVLSFVGDLVATGGTPGGPTFVSDVITRLRRRRRR